MIMWRRFSLVVCVWLGLAEIARADPPTRVHVLAIGYNGVPASATDTRLRELRYADDDAAGFARLARDLGGRAIVLSNFDVDTTRRFPGLASQARPPLREELSRAVREMNVSFERDRGLGIEPVVLLTYSGHGLVEAGAPPALVLADGELTQEALYSGVLAALKARFIHVIVDACHAEAVVRSRDVQAETVPLAADEVRATLSRLTLQGLPNVGAMVASSASAQAHEWDTWQHGVFTHEVLSGLRGAADVNGDLRIEYSEMAAFLSAVNREVRDPAARIKPLLKPPAGAPRAPIVELRHVKGAAFLTGRPGFLGGLWIESDDGQRIADLRSEQDQQVRLLVPGGQRLFVRGVTSEAEVMVPVGGRVAFDTLAMRTRTLHARGALDLSLARGLFASTFGPSYYRGYVDHSEELVAVPLSIARSAPPRALAPASATTTDRGPSPLAWTGLGVSGALLVASAAFGVAALHARSDFDGAHGLEHASSAASERFDDYRALSLGALLTGIVSGGVTYVLFAQP